jgi:hypothetical protein
LPPDRYPTCLGCQPAVARSEIEVDVDPYAMNQEVLPQDPRLDLDDDAVAEAIESIQEAQYFDASSMALLNPDSLVSTPLLKRATA